MEGRCAIHPGESAAHCFSCYLDEPCEAEGCERSAENNGAHREAPHKRGAYCNAHTSWDHPSFCRND